MDMPGPNSGLEKNSAPNDDAGRHNPVRKMRTRSASQQSVDLRGLILLRPLHCLFELDHTWRIQMAARTDHRLDITTLFPLRLCQ